MAASVQTVFAPGDKNITITKVKVKKGQRILKGAIFCLFKSDTNSTQKLKSTSVGTVVDIFVKDGDELQPGGAVVSVEACSHPTVMKDMCADCGADLRREHSTAGDRKEEVSASVAMVHNIPELIVSQKLAMELGKADEERLLKTRKLVLLVDLDQTLIHTTNDNIPPNLKDVHHFQLWHGKQLMWYHTRLRPGTHEFLENISKLYELHICTFGVRMYAHTIAKILDPEGKFFSHRILSRDECFNATSKVPNLKALFPCGDSMVCIIDDREDVWNFVPNLVHVKPYRFFQGTADINAPPGLTKTENDDQPVIHRVRRVSQSEIDAEKTDSQGKNKKEKSQQNGNDIKYENSVEMSEISRNMDLQVSSGNEKQKGEDVMSDNNEKDTVISEKGTIVAITSQENIADDSVAMETDIKESELDMKSVDNPLTTNVTDDKFEAETEARTCDLELVEDEVKVTSVKPEYIYKMGVLDHSDYKWGFWTTQIVV